MEKKRFKKIYIEITNICNLNCEFCIKSNREKRQMSVSEFEMVMEKIQGYTDYIYLHIKGEPLIHKDFEQLLDIAHKYNMHVNLTTNGVLLKEKQDILAKSKALRQINISLHSLNQNKDFPIDTNEYLYNVTSAVDNIRKENDVYVSYRIWDINKQNITDDKIITYLSKKYSIDVYENLKNLKSITLDKNIFLNVDTTFKWPSLNENIVSQTGSCYGLIDQIGILVDGTVVPCCLDQEGDINLGNIYTYSLEEILNAKRIENILDGFKNNKLIEPLCQRCGFRVNKRKK